MSIVIHSARVIADGLDTAEGWIVLADGAVIARGEGAGWQDVGADEVVDARARAGEGAVLTPGFVDLHGHGGGGASFEGDTDAIRTARAVHRAHGTTRAVLSLVTGALPHLEQQLSAIAALTATDADILGVHLEGPFLAASHKGAHDEHALHDPTPAAVTALLEAGGGQLRQITLAPELPGALDAVARFVDAGVVVAVGHTGADMSETHEAFDAGARLLTHAFNAMPGLHHRAPGPLGAALADPRVTLEVIADGVHVHPALVRMLFAAAPGRVALITDAMAAAGVGDGHYRLGSLDVDVAVGVARLRDGGAIAGSTLTQDAALRVSVAAGVPLLDGVEALTVTPARVLGRGDLGTFRGGGVGDAVLLTRDLVVRDVWFAGERVDDAARLH